MQHEEEFDSLRRALRLKRHEVPPPGHFRNFSAQVISRIRENDVHDRARGLDSAAWEAPWLARLLGFLQGRPIYSGALGAAVCVLLLGAVFYSGNPPATSTGGNNLRLGTPQDLAGVGLNVTAEPATASSASPIGVLPPGTTLFDKLRPLQSAPAFTTTNLIK